MGARPEPLGCCCHPDPLGLQAGDTQAVYRRNTTGIRGVYRGFTWGNGVTMVRLWEASRRSWVLLPSPRCLQPRLKLRRAPRGLVASAVVLRSTRVIGIGRRFGRLFASALGQLAQKKRASYEEQQESVEPPHPLVHQRSRDGCQPDGERGERGLLLFRPGGRGCGYCIGGPSFCLWRRGSLPRNVAPGRHPPWFRSWGHGGPEN